MAADNSSVLFTSQVTSTTTPAALADQPCGEVAVQNDPGNSVNILVGNSASQFLVLAPGDTLVIAVTNAKLVWHRAASGTPTLNVLIRN